MGNDWGLCESCVYSDSCGDFGTIPCCNREEEPELIEEYEDMLGVDSEHQCDGWKPFEPVFCMKHYKWYLAFPCGGCEICMEEWGKEHDKKISDSNQKEGGNENRKDKQCYTLE